MSEPQNVTFETGAVRSSDADNESWHLISPIGLRRVAETCREGEEKYSAYNWEKGMSVVVMLNHALRHIYLYLFGNRDEDHLAHAAWNLLGAMHSEELWPELNEGTLRGEGGRAPGAIAVSGGGAIPPISEPCKTESSRLDVCDPFAEPPRPHIAGPPRVVKSCQNCDRNPDAPCCGKCYRKKLESSIGFGFCLGLMCTAVITAILFALATNA